MFESRIDAINAWLESHQAELLENTRKLLQIDTIEGEPKENAPYGEGNRKALDFCLELSQQAGMTTVDLEGHLGYATFGAGERLVMALGHIDVVPVGPGWKHAPFGAEIEEGYVYARGATDDKGPTMAAFYALRAIKEVFPEIPARMRMAFGCNEESGFGCVERYVKTEEAPTFGVAPDSGWPCYNAEKGIANLEVSVTPPQGAFLITSLEGGQRPNIVIDSCTARITIGASARKHVESKVEDKWDNNITCSWEGDTLVATAKGKAAHGSTPFIGDSAATRLFRFLYSIAPIADQEFFEKLLMTSHPSGVGLGIIGSDDVAGDLTSNLGIVSMLDGKINLLFNVRYPVKWTGKQLFDLCHERLGMMGGDWKLDVTRDSPPLYFPADHAMVKTIINVYEEETGERLRPGSMGGGTYARAVANTISIGTGWPGDGDAHETDERVAVESLYKMSRIYAKILLRLAILP